jgi:hypothetical protein
MLSPDPGAAHGFRATALIGAGEIAAPNFYSVFREWCHLEVPRASRPWTVTAKMAVPQQMTLLPGILNRWRKRPFMNPAQG